MVRRKRVNAKRNPKALVPVPLVALLVVVGAVSLVYLWLCSRCEGLAREIQQMERQNEELQRRAVNEHYKWLNLHSLREVQTALVRHGIQMDWPDGRRVIHLAEPQGGGTPKTSDALQGQWVLSGRTRPHE